ncbi:hypothetical protein IC582_018613 [Cucumis melo]
MVVSCFFSSFFGFKMLEFSYNLTEYVGFYSIEVACSFGILISLNWIGILARMKLQMESISNSSY